jgi:hypothetical protein
MSHMLRMTEAEFANLRRARSASVKQKPRQAATYALKPDYARELAIQIRDAGLRLPLLEYAFDKQLTGGGRGWMLDLAWRWTEPMLAVEVDGAVHRIKGRHKGDIQKHQALFVQGWKLLRVTPAQVRNGEALALVREALA